jgi:hypothetical protein
VGSFARDQERRPEVEDLNSIGVRPPGCRHVVRHLDPERLGVIAEAGTVSTEGADFPAWRRDGRELFYVDPTGRMVAVAATLTPSFSKGQPVVLLRSAPCVGRRT